MPVNDSEARLVTFTKKTFLSIWSHNNLFYKKGKEFCDVLIIFGDDVIIMSDKLIGFNQDIDISVAWSRWFSRAIDGSSRQLNGAFKHINLSPEKLYVDAQVTIPFKMELPSPDRIRIHLIAVVNGIAEENKKKHGYSGLKFDSACKGDDVPLTIGLPEKEFIHYFNEYSLDNIFSCLDTTSDFINYLEARKKLLLAPVKHIIIHGEEELLAAWMLSQPGNSHFYMPIELFDKGDSSYVIGPGFWSEYNNEHNIGGRDLIRRDSYIIDSLIEHIYDEYSKQALVIGQDEDINYHEKAFRLLASESRLGRQLISMPLIEVMNEGPDTFWANVVASNDISGLLYVWLIYPIFPFYFSDEYVSKLLVQELNKYIVVAQSKFKDAKLIFGICLPNAKDERTERLFILYDATQMSAELQALANEFEENEGILANMVSSVNISVRV